MKNRNLLLAGIVLASLTSCGSYVRIGDLNGISNRNLDDSQQYVLLEREVEAIAKADTDALEEAVDNLTKEYQGEFLRNVKIYVKSNGKKIKVNGDVWGVQNTNVNVTTNANVKIELNVGDNVVFDKKGKIVYGKIIGLNSDSVIVEYGKRDKKVVLKYDEITKTE
jgi:HSP20 family molecular chaperone IbpA